ncbi:hypothetical protein RL72_00403 [Microbacterium azadirachtae]|uniref:Uncharacterized protein n=2 Tax=Microbacterium azadirachtae TaxID=582680 RepID=A0A0F0L5Y5_9MICO|nr:hypothetical protein RL72_00403 [Microbacterium azadirachtae]
MWSTPPAPVSEWMLSVATVLPVPYREPAPYALGEAISELRAYAQATRPADWMSRTVMSNRTSLRAELDAQIERLGKHLHARLGEALGSLRNETNRERTIATADRILEEWHSQAAITDAFQDLCDTAHTPQTTTDDLGTRAALIASQLGAAATSSSSTLHLAANMLIDQEESLALRQEKPLPAPLTEQHRLAMARDALTATVSGKVVVWTVYRRATIYGVREVTGPITFLQPEWALPNAFDPDGQDFPERAELREIRTDVNWLDDVHTWSLEPNSNLVMARVDLGTRLLAGAVEEALRRVDAILSIAVHAGGVSWQQTKHSAVVLDRKPRQTTFGPALNIDQHHGDSYGMHGTAQLLAYVSETLGEALTAQPLPDALVEALTALQEAKMTDHRDVTFYGARPVTPRVATALEDHAMELIASVLEVHPNTLATALQYRRAQAKAENDALRQLLSPLNDSWARPDHARRRELEAKLSRHDTDGVLIVNVANAITLQEDIRALPMTALQRADFEHAVAICTNPERELDHLLRTWKSTSLLKARHRRVRNAVNHGLPLSAIAVNSIRDYAAATSDDALTLALNWFKNHESGPNLVAQDKIAWDARIARTNSGESWAEASARTPQDA